MCIRDRLYTEGKDGYWNLNNVKIKYEGEDEYYASLVTEKIAAIGTVTEESEDAIKEARAAYDALTSAQKKLVTNYDVLDEAELQLEIIKGTAVTTKFSLVGDDVHGSSGHVSYSTWIANATITVTVSYTHLSANLQRFTFLMERTFSQLSLLSL